MSTCPRCNQPVDSQVVNCPHCHAVLKAYGHPGIPLYQAPTGDYLCATCTYHADDTCNFPQRPYAKECTLYHNLAKIDIPLHSRSFPGNTFKFWMQRNVSWLWLIGLVLMSILFALVNQDHEFNHNLPKPE